MPSRIVREGILDSRAVNALSEEAELFYRRVMSIVDDYGRCEADPEMLRIWCFPRRMATWPVERVQKCLYETAVIQTEEGVPLVTVYSVKGKFYLQINNFGQRMRTMKSKCPPPDGQATVICPSNASALQLTAMCQTGVGQVADVCPPRKAELLPEVKGSEETREAEKNPARVETEPPAEKFDPPLPSNAGVPDSVRMFRDETDTAWEWLVKEYPHTREPGKWEAQAFASAVKTPEDVSALRENLPLWKASGKYRRGAGYSLERFLRDGLFRQQPPPEKPQPSQNGSYVVPKDQEMKRYKPPVPVEEEQEELFNA